MSPEGVQLDREESTILFLAVPQYQFFSTAGTPNGRMVMSPVIERRQSGLHQVPKCGSGTSGSDSAEPEFLFAALKAPK